VKSVSAKTPLTIAPALTPVTARFGVFMTPLTLACFSNFALHSFAFAGLPFSLGFPLVAFAGALATARSWSMAREAPAALPTESHRFSTALLSL